MVDIESIPSPVNLVNTDRLMRENVDDSQTPLEP